MTTKTLIQLSVDAREITTKLLQSGGEFTDEIAAMVDVSAKDLATKVDGYCEIMSVAKAEAAYWDDKAKQYKAVANSMGTLEKNLKARIKLAMENMERTEIEGNDFRFKLSGTKDSVKYFPDQIPDAYKKTTVITEPDKEKISGDISMGIKIPGVVTTKNFALRSYKNKAVK